MVINDHVHNTRGQKVKAGTCAHGVPTKTDTWSCGHVYITEECKCMASLLIHLDKRSLIKAGKKVTTKPNTCTCVDDMIGRVVHSPWQCSFAAVQDCTFLGSLSQPSPM